MKSKFLRNSFARVISKANRNPLLQLRLVKTCGLAIALTAVVNSSAYAQAVQSASIKCESSGDQNTLGVEFNFRSAVLSIVAGGRAGLAVRVTLGVKNTSTVPSGISVLSRETSASTDTGLAFGFSAVSGLGFCGGSRPDCMKMEDLTTVSQGASANIILSLQGPEANDFTKKQSSQAGRIDLAGVLLASIGKERGYLSFSCTDVPLRNMTQ